jgi:integration host factor subunit alpha
MLTFVDNIEIPPALTKASVADLLSAQLKISSRESGELVDAFFELIQEQLCNGEDVKLSGFGSFDIHQKNARPGRNPKTGEAILIASRQVVTFSAGPKLKNRMSPRLTSQQPSDSTPSHPLETVMRDERNGPLRPTLSET